MNTGLAFAEIAGVGLFGVGFVKRIIGISGGNNRSAKVLTALLSGLTGLTALSCFFTAFWFAGARALSAAWLASGTLFLLGAIFFLRSKVSSTVCALAVPASERAPRWLFALFLAAVSIIGVIVLARAIHNPEGGWDSWMIWNLRSRLVFSVEQVHEAFPREIVGTHPNYPLFLAGLNSAIWTIFGTPIPVAPLVISIFFAVVSASILILGLRCVGDSPRALIAGIMLLCTPKFGLLANSQEADLLVSVFYLVAAIMLLLAQESTGTKRYRLFAFAGMALSASLWTKNDGSIFFLAIVISILLFSKTKMRQRCLDIGTIILGAVPILILIAYFKLAVAPADDFVREAFLNKIVRFLDLHRLASVLLMMVRRLCYFQMWGVFLMLAPFAWGYFGGKKTRRPATRLLWGAMGFALLELCVIYAITPYDLAWHLMHSADRLFIQLWPTFIFLFLSSLKPSNGESSLVQHSVPFVTSKQLRQVPSCER